MDQVLRPRFAKTFEDYGVWLLVLPPLALLILPALLLTMFVDYSEVAAFYSSLLAKDKLFDLVLPIVILFPLTIAFLLAFGRSRIELSDNGIRFVTGLPGFLARQTDWELSWDEMESVTLKPQPLSHPLTAAIQIRSAGAPRRLVAWQWIVPGDPPIKTDRGSLLFGRKQRYQSLLEMTPLVRAFQAQGKLTEYSAGDEAVEDSLQNADLPSKVIAGLFVAAIAYFIVDSFFGLEEYYVGIPPWQWLFVIGLFGAIAAWLALNSGRTRLAQASLIAILFGGGMAMAAYPGLLRLNAWLDPNGLVNYEYTLGSNDTWSTTAGAPDLIFDIDSRYWKQFEPGDVKDFQVRDGGLGFAQVNMAPIYVEQRAFYAEPNLSLATDQGQDP